MTKEQLLEDNKHLHKALYHLAAEITSLYINHANFLDYPIEFFDNEYWINQALKNTEEHQNDETT